MQDSIITTSFIHDLINCYDAIPELGILDSLFAQSILFRANSQILPNLTEKDIQRITQISSFLASHKKPVIYRGSKEQRNQKELEKINSIFKELDQSGKKLDEIFLEIEESQKDPEAYFKKISTLPTQAQTHSQPISDKWAIIKFIKTIWKSVINSIHSFCHTTLQRQLQKTNQFWQAHCLFLNESHSRHTPRIAEAQIIFMGDTHAFDEHRNMQKGILNQYATNGDFLLVEGFFATGWEATLLSQVYQSGVSSSLNIQTWDNEKYLNKTRALGKKLLDAKNDLSIQFDLTKHNLKMKKYIEIRNRTLEEKVSSLLKSYPNKKIFVIAGDAHVNPEKLTYDLRDHLDIQDASTKSTIITFSNNFHDNTDDYLSDFVNAW